MILNPSAQRHNRPQGYAPTYGLTARQIRNCVGLGLFLGTLFCVVTCLVMP